ncbi:MAG: hypothetical protein SV186_02800 [Candidatus Nanohaloarchaea archaeon]|nr:hypothetical protein [Candidatus Nanohaloarchaea archaeon]
MDDWRRGSGLIVLAVLLFAAPAAAQSGFDVTVSSEDTTVRPAQGETAKFHITVTNTAEQQQRFRVSYITGTATDPAWYYLENPFITLEPNETEMTTLYATPDMTAQAGTMGPRIIVFPLDDPDNRFNKLVSFSVIRDTNLEIISFEGPQAMYKPGETVNVSMTVKNVIQRDIAANRYQVVMTVNGDQTTRPVPSIEAGETERITAALELESYRAGIYDLTVEIREIGGEVHSTQQAKIEVTKERRLGYDHTSSKSFLSSSKTVRVTNTGNVVVEDLNVSKSAAWYIDPFVSFPQEPDQIVNVDGERKYVWTVERLEPGESVSFSYTVSYWSLVLVLLILVAAGAVLVRRFRSVTLVKSGRRSGDRLSIHLRVKNNTGSRIEDVEVEDFVPGIASLIEKFDSRSPEKIQSTDDGTKMVWKLGMMEPGEERIITYKVKPRVQVEGYISLPEAEVTYEKKGQEKARESHPISADFS